MRTERNRFPVRAISLAVRSALLLMCAAPALALAQQAMTDEVKELVYPTTWFDLGALVVDQSLYQILQILSVAIFEKTELSQGFFNVIDEIEGPTVDKQLNLFEF